MSTKEQASEWLELYLKDDELAHYGVLGMKWGVRKDRPSGISSRKTDREAMRDAKEHVQAKLYYGTGAGTRRKLIKAKIEGKSKKNPSYKKALDYHVENQDVDKRLGQIKGQRARATAKATTAKTSRGIINTVRGNPQAAGASVAAAAGAAIFVHNRGWDKKAYRAAVNSKVGKASIASAKIFIRKLKF